MAKQLNINLAFTADTEKAKMQLQDLQNTLNSVINFSGMPKNFTITKEITEASMAAAQLKINLENATNINTGKLDLGKFVASMKSSQMSLEKYQSVLLSLGPQGERAFVQLANSISDAEMPLRSTSTLVSNLWTTLKNTARWQISSSVLHGFMGTLSSAYNYAQDLNESLNNIRIVSGASADEMAKFAVEANKAAKALSTTTVEYTNASLIYYQQGLNDQQVKERTDTTIKLANVARQSVEETSDQLTAIWNNYATEGENLERYADVMTALGAATASSTAEIAGGLEKFSSIADMIGLSFDYAASALATITATTRQSEEVVGTALKTIFARIQGLNLGETLDDGTTLNKYSEALNKVGISIFDQTGNLKEMDNILDEIGQKWDILSKDQQIALAQTVAGVRQYNQLVALMDNWDFMQENLSIAQNATGALSKQADIYAESWEAARDRVKAAAENIYDSILNDDFFITILNNVEGLLNIFSKLVDSAGGLKGVIAALGVVLTSVFSQQLANSINNLTLNLSTLTKKGKEATTQFRIDAQQKVINMHEQDMTKNADVYNVATSGALATYDKERAKLKTLLIQKSSELNDSERQTLSILMDQNSALGQQMIDYNKIIDASRKQGVEIFEKLSFDTGNDFENLQKELEGLANNGEKSYAKYGNAIKEATFNSKSFTNLLKEQGMSSEKINSIIHLLADTYYKMGNATADATNAQKQFQASSESVATAIQKGIPSLKSFGEIAVQVFSSISQTSMALFSLTNAFSTISEGIDSGNFGLQEFLSVTMSLSIALPTLVKLLGTLKDLFSAETIAKIANATATWAQVAAEQKLNNVKNNGQNITRRSIKETINDTKQKITNTWNKNALAGNSNYTQLKNGAYTERTTQGFISGAQAEQMAGKEALTALGAKAASVAPAVAGIALIVGAVIWIRDQMTQAEQALEKAKKTAQELSENYDSAKQKYDEFISAQSNYNTITNEINELTKGTLEYQEALLKANEAAGELLSTNQNLAYTIEDGQIVIDEKSLEEAQKSSLKTLELAQAAKLAGDQEVKNAELNLEKRDLARKLNSYSDFGQKGINSLAAGGVGAGAGALIGSTIPIVGTAIGAIIGGSVGVISGLIQNTSTTTEQQALDILSTQAEKDSAFLAKIESGRITEEEFKEIGIEDEALINSLTQNGEEVAQLIKEIQTNTAAINAQNDLVSSQVLSNNETVQKSKYQNEIVDIIGDSYGIAYDKAMQSDWIDSWGKSGIAKIDGANAEAKKVFEEYLKYAGLENSGYTLKDTTGTDTNRKFVYEDAEGNEKTISLEAMQAARAAYEASETLNTSATKLAETFNKLEQSTNIADQSLLSFVSQKNFEGSSYGELDTLYNQLTNNGESELNSKDIKTYIENSLGETLTDDLAIQYGYDNAEAMINAFNEQLINAKIAWDEIEIPDNLLGIDNVSLETALNLQEQIQNMNIGPLGEKAGQLYIEGLNKVLKNLTFEDQQAALIELAKIDWSDWNSLEQVKIIMEEFGVEIDTTSDEWLKFAQNMRDANGAIPDFSKLKQTLIDISSILKDLEFGNIISDEDYQTLIAYNAAWNEFFMLQADGTRKFIGNSQQMLEITRNNINEQRKELKIRQEAQAEFEKASQDYQENGIRVETDWKNKSGSDTATATNLMNSTNRGTQAMLEVLNYSPERIQEMIDQANSVDEKIKATGEMALKEMYNAIYNFTQEDLNITEEELNQMMASTATNLADLQNLLEAGEISLEAYNTQINILTTQAMNEVESLSELDSLKNMYNISNNDELYTQNLIRLGETYDNCTEAVKNYQLALSNLDETNSNSIENLKEAEDELRSLISIQESAEKYSLDADSLSVQAKQLAKAYDLSAEQAAELATRNQRLNKGISQLVDSWDDWKKTLKTTDKTSQDYAATVADLTDTLRDLTGAADNFEIPEGFLDSEKNLALIDQAAQGSQEAINQLGNALAYASIQAMNFNAELAASLGSTIDDSQFESYKFTVLTGIDELKNKLQELSVGQDISNILGENWIKALNEMALATNMSVDQMNSLLGQLGVQAKVETKPVKQKMSVPTYTDYYKIENYNPPEYDDKGEMIKPASWSQERYTVPGKPYEVEGYVQVAQISTDENPLTADITYVGTGGGNAAGSSPRSSGISSSSGGGGGGSSSPATKKQYTKKSDVVDRYHEINAAIEDLSDALSDVNKQSDRLYGKSRISAMEQEASLLQDQIKLYKEKAKQIQAYLSLDQSALINNEYGIKFSFDESGNISNYTEVMTSLYNQLHAEEMKLNSQFSTEEAQSDYEEKVIEPLRDKISAVQDLIDQYESTLAEQEDIKNLIDDAFYEWQDKNYEILSYKLELKLEVNEMALEELEYYLNKISDDFYKMAESAALLQSQSPEYTGMLSSYEDSYNSLNAAFEAGEISQADYIDGLKEARQGLIDTLSSLIDLDKEMTEYYQNTLDKASNELDRFTNQLDHCSEILQHFQNVLGLIGKENDLDTIGKILEGQLKNTQNTLKVQKQNYEMLLKQKEDLEDKLNVAPLGSKEREMIQKEYDAITEAVINAENEVFATTESLGEISAQILENNLSKAQKALEEMLTGGSSIDKMMENLDRLSKSQEEYLTKTNQLYETNKLIRQAQQDMDKSDNELAKKKYKDYIAYIEQLEKQGKLSEYELSIAQAKYEVLQAELALEDARNDTSTMRLVRTDDGNWDYVFTANQDKVSEAEQALADAQNNLYNIGLQGAEDYQTKYAEAMQEAVETFQEINANYQAGMYASEEEYNKAMLEAQQYYYDLLKTYQEQYQLASELIAHDSSEAYVEALDMNIDSLEDFKNATNDYLSNCNDAFNQWKDNTSEVSDIIREDLDETINKIDDVVNVSDDLTDKITGEVIPGIEDELWAVREVTDAWAEQRDQLYETIRVYEELIKTIREVILAQMESQQSMDTPSSDIGGPLPDYSAAMADVKYGTPEYNEWLEKRAEKIAAGYDVGAATNERLDAYFKKYNDGGAAIRAKGYKYFTDVPESVWDELLLGFKTGGYTGDWGNGGKVALLHEKELVLNQEDTSNLLNTISFVREIVSTLEQNARLASIGFNNLSSNNFLTDFNKEAIRQEVSIVAEFPNAVDHSEIEMAFNNLMNDATQYIFERNRD